MTSSAGVYHHLEHYRGGQVIQTVTAVMRDTASKSVGTQATWEFTDFPISIALSKPSNLILVTGFISIAINGGAQNVRVGIRRATSNVNGAMGGATGFGSAKGNRRACHSETMHNGNFGISSVPIHFIDAPNSTAMQRYYPQFSHGSSGTRTIYINRGESDSNSAEQGRCISIMTAQEIVT
jgi:hypothetical protein|tara:strand:- start:41 stop:583 length:543 start_codon:yes stop_codon:yes gene_type:complete